MNSFTIKFNSTEVNQQQIIDRLRSCGYDVIQVSDGLVAKVDGATSSVPEVLGELASGVSVELVDPNLIATDPSFSKDARQFVGV